MPPPNPKNASPSERSPSILLIQRQEEVLKLVQVKGQASVDELARHFGVSDDTIRRDLLHLEKNRMLLRTHGGATATTHMVHHETPFAMRVKDHAEAKTRIGRAAAQLISDGETLIINGGSTTVAFAANLAPRRNLTLVTNNVALVFALPPGALLNSHLIGGQYNPGNASTLGVVEFGSTTVSVDTAVLGVSGLTSANGISTTHIDEAQMQARMIESARRTIVLADASKFGHNTFARIAPLSAIDVLVTDAVPSAELCQFLSAANVELIVAPT